jgi:DNA-binding CsgD family transcriptional regulator
MSTNPVLTAIENDNPVFPSFRYMREPDSAVALATRVAATASLIQSENDLLSWMTGPLRELIPHRCAAIGIGHVRHDYLSVDRVVAVDVSSSYAPGMKANGAEMINPVMRLWFESREPQVIDPSKHCRVRHDKWLQNLKKHGLKNGIADGHIEVQTGNAVFIELFNFDEDPQPFGHVMRDFCTDNVRAAWKRIDETELARRAAKKIFEFSDAEHKVLALLKLGKSNWEIATILSKSPSTVKTQLGKLYEKTGTLNRTQLSKLDF